MAFSAIPGERVKHPATSAGYFSNRTTTAGDTNKRQSMGSLSSRRKLGGNHKQHPSLGLGLGNAAFMMSKSGFEDENVNNSMIIEQPGEDDQAALQIGNGLVQRAQRSNYAS